ncbi:glycosyltransferase family 1 protein [Clostridium sp. MB40-C1]|uniref:glycosyltransferase family 4 protein n=1 Tax=Clostridium sp. MB40-C1 TaxID=3070996 RepID=UPI0027E20BB8|nr:glycosyltransferase family 1 protein [Clostridium sp. MB40-C1]WMJ80626.1 glycosyltransferase family 1 protein [Clostridium sp. MB40-C1]
MKVCIDGIGLNMLQGTSLCSYTYEFLKNLTKIYPELKYNLIWDNDKEEKKYLEDKLIYLNLNRLTNDYSILENYIEENDINIFHSINNGFSIPYNKKCKYVSTIYDLLPIFNMSYTDKLYYEKFMNSMPIAIENSDKIIAVSKFIKDQIIEYFHVDNKKIEVIYPGCSNYFRSIDSNITKEFIKKNYNIYGEFLLYVGSIHPRKNLHVLLKVFKSIKYYNATKNTKLVIIGNYKGKAYEYYLKLKSLARFLKIQDDVIFTGSIDYQDTLYFYNSSECLINLSLYEGFPLSVIEAMACGTPVICSNNKIFNEIIGDYAILVDVDDEVYIKENILECLINHNYKKKLCKKGIKKSLEYKWENNVFKMHGVYESLMDPHIK